MKVFVSCPFSGILDEKTKLVKDEYRYFFDELVSFFNDNKIDYYLAITRENWGLDYVSPEDSVKSDYEGVKSSDVLIVIPGNPISGGVHIELGWASALCKNMHIFLENGKKYSPVVMGLNALSKVEYHNSNTFPSRELLDDIKSTISRLV